MDEFNLSEGSKSYYNEADIYEAFSQAEDFSGQILEFLKNLVLDKDVLDLGCGTGKYLTELAPLASSYTGLDVSPFQLEIARTKVEAANLKNVNLICNSAEKIDLPASSLDLIISTWVLGTIKEDERRLQVVKEAERVVRKQGSIYLVENDLGGKFEEIRGRYPNIERTKMYNDWLEGVGFNTIKRFQTSFEFNSIQEAKKVMGSIWGDEVTGKKVNSKSIGHNIVIFEKKIN